MIEFNVDVDLLKKRGLLEPEDHPTSWADLFHLWGEQGSQQLVYYDYDENENENCYGSILRQVKHACAGELPISRMYSTFEENDTITRIHYRLNESSYHTKDFKRDGPYIDEDLVEWLESLVNEYTNYRILSVNIWNDTFTNLFILPSEALR